MDFGDAVYIATNFNAHVFHPHYSARQSVPDSGLATYCRNPAAAVTRSHLTISLLI